MNDYSRFKKNVSYSINKKLYSLNINDELFEEIKTILMLEIDKAYRRGYNRGFIDRGDSIREDIREYYKNNNDLELEEFLKENGYIQLN